MEKKERNVEITKKRLEGASARELSRDYRMTEARINQIVSDTRAKYPEEFTNYE